MRSPLRALIISMLAGFGSQVPASDCLAQNARDFMHIFGAIVQSTMVQAAQAEWRKLAPADVSCVDQTLHQRGISLQALVNNGITPADSRISDVLATCRFQPAIQQTATPQFQPSSEPTRTVGQASKYSLDKIPLGGNISFESANYKEYQCRPSDQFQGFTWCQKQRSESSPRGTYLSSYSILHTEEGRVFYLNRQLAPAFFAPGEANSDIDRLSRSHGEQPRLIQMPSRNDALTGVIAYWGDVVLEPLDPNSVLKLASGQSPVEFCWTSSATFKIRSGRDFQFTESQVAQVTFGLRAMTLMAEGSYVFSL
jgi:hypothetical protein